MEVNQILCKATGRTLKADSIYKVRDDSCLEAVVGICKMCPYSEHGREAGSECKKCYGTIVQVTKRIKSKTGGRTKMTVDNYKNSFLRVNNDEFIQDMGADIFLEDIDILANLNSCNWNHVQKLDDGLRACDRPKTWKTDCIACKNRCKNENKLTPCQKAKEFLENNGVSPERDSSKNIMKIKLPDDCICKEQAQMIYYL